MKNTSSPRPSPELDSSENAVFDPRDTHDMTTTPLAPGTVRVLLAVDVPAAALAGIKADWAIVARANGAAPEYVSAFIAAALRRLQEQTVQVSGVAVLEPAPDLVAYWTRAA